VLRLGNRGGSLQFGDAHFRGAHALAGVAHALLACQVGIQLRLALLGVLAVDSAIGIALQRRLSLYVAEAFLRDWQLRGPSGAEVVVGLRKGRSAGGDFLPGAEVDERLSGLRQDVAYIAQPFGLCLQQGHAVFGCRHARMQANDLVAHLAQHALHVNRLNLFCHCFPRFVLRHTAIVVTAS